jgi:hypothetical protein
VREPDGVSYQIYSALNYYDSLLLGHYPTGNLYTYDGRSLRLLAGWPPVMPGVSTEAREAQSLAIYGGDLYVGVWPWGELWRYDPDRCGWLFAGRMFTHPAPTAATQHPYENETYAVHSIGNAWGQRVPSLLPLDDGLYVSTSAKSSEPWDPKFSFLGGGKWQEYGAIHKLTLPGHLTVTPEWVDGPTTFTFTISGSTLRVVQDGVQLGEVTFDSPLRLALSTTGMSWGTGIYGNFRGAMFTHTVSLTDS